MLNQLVRYIPVIDALSCGQAIKLLDVGCGFQGIGPYISHRYIGCDPLLSPGLRAQRKPHPRMLPVAGSAVQLPFPNASFDVVVSLDMLEHIPPSQRAFALKELYRVANQKVIVGFPEGEHAMRWEKYTAKWYRLMGHPIPEWLEEHFEYGLPTHQEIATMMRSAGMRYTAWKNVNCAVHFVINILESSLLAPAVSEASRIMMQSRWNPEEHRWRANAIRRLRGIFFQFLKTLNFGKTVRRIYQIDKPAQTPVVSKS